MNYKKEIENIWKVIKFDVSDESIGFRLCGKNHKYVEIRNGNIIDLTCTVCRHSYWKVASVKINIPTENIVKKRNKFKKNLPKKLRIEFDKLFD